MTTVVEIPGVGEVEFPDGMSPEQITQAARNLIGSGGQTNEEAERRLGQLTATRAPESTATGAFFQGAGEQILGNLAGLPDVAARGFQGFRQLLAGQPGAALEELRTEQIPSPSGRDISATAAGVEAFIPGLLMGEPIEAFRRGRAGAQVEAAQTEREHPVAQNLGEVAGDAATLLGLRAPGVAGRAALPARAAPAAAGQLTLPKVAQNVLQSAPVKKLAGNVGRAAEAGAEGAVISMLNDNDPLFTAGASAGAQLAGDLTTAMLRNPGKTFLGMAALMLATREAIPGFDPSVFEAVDISANKIGLGIITGLMTALPGLRLSDRNQSAAAAVLLDAVSALPRGSMQSVLDAGIASVQSGTDTVGEVARKVLTNPDALSDDQIRRFERAARNADLEELQELNEELARGPTRTPQSGPFMGRVFNELMGGG